ncbi:GNAT family N-acetyltransferase [Fluviicola sp.]|uniref:GNAT family N-acetyltransferase n=1 Tax=Fluviicola sp. TaxID=1917219 RepID=UPI0031D7B1DD
MDHCISSDILEKWLTAWSLSRELPPPVNYKSGYKIEVGYEKQKIRYVFPKLTDDFIRLSETIYEPWVFLKVCASPEELKSKVPGRWILQPQGYMMYRDAPMFIQNKDLPKGYRTEFDTYNSTIVLRIISPDGEPASSGRLILVDDLAVYDRIMTEKNHQRKGLAAFLMRELERIALSENISKNFLVATEQGRGLYESLGWKVCSLYTSVVIPAE